jgi:hypothetical protein
LRARSIWLDEICIKFANVDGAPKDRRILGVPPVEIAGILKTPGPKREQITSKQQANNKQTLDAVQN